MRPLNVTEIIDILMHGNQLKRTARAGWVQRGVSDAESVAGHSFGAAYTAMVLAELIDESLDLGHTLALVALHDLPEGLTTDIPRPAWRLFPDGLKQTVEDAALEKILGQVTFAPRWREWWAELVTNETLEARLVHDADKLDQMLQAYVYERQTGNRALSEFWEQPYQFYFQAAQEIYDELHRRRVAGYST